MSIIKCSECGAKISDKALECPNCGCPIEEIKFRNKKAKKKTILITGGIIFAAVVVLSLISFGVYRFIQKPDKSGYYNGYKWGMSYEDVKKKVGNNAIENSEDKTILCNEIDYEGKKGIDALILYDCENNSLNEITVLITNNAESSYTDDSLIEEMKKEFNELYGESEQNSGVWNTPKSEIQLIYFFIRTNYFNI